MVMTKQRSLKNETNLSYFRREWIYHIRSSKNANAIVSVGDDATFLQAVRKTGFREDCLYAGISTKMKFRSTAISILITLIQPFRNYKNEIEVRKYPTIQVDVDGSTSFHCLNEFSLRSSIIKTFVVDVHVDDLYFRNI